MRSSNDDNRGLYFSAAGRGPRRHPRLQALRSRYVSSRHHERFAGLLAERRLKTCSITKPYAEHREPLRIQPGRHSAGSGVRQLPYITIYDTSTWAAESGFSFMDATANAVSFFATPAYRIRGTVRDKDGNLVSRTVRAHRRSDGVLVAQTVSDAVTGEYELLVYPDSPAEEYDVQFLAAPGELLNDLIYARTTAEPVS